VADRHNTVYASVYWYKCVYSDGRGVVHTKEGDVDANSALHATHRVEAINRNVWQGKIIHLRVYAMDWDTGSIAEDPCIDWTRHGAKGKQVRALDYDVEDDYQDMYSGYAYHTGPERGQRSPSVTSEGIFACDSGHAWWDTHTVHPTMAFKAKET
jgi:hypothetical protein